MSNLTIDQSGALLLKVLLPQPSWYEGQAISVPMAAIELVENLSEIKAPDRPKEITEASVSAWREKLRVWGDQPFDVPITNKQRESVKICLDKMLAKGGFAVINFVRLDQNFNVVPSFLSLFTAIYGKWEAPESKHALKLTRSSAFVLKGIIERDVWYGGSPADVIKTLRSAYQIVDKLSVLPAEGPEDEEASNAWRAEPFALELSEAQRDTAKTVIKQALDKGQLRLAKEVRNLVCELGLNE